MFVVLKQNILHEVGLFNVINHCSACSLLLVGVDVSRKYLIAAWGDKKYPTACVLFRTTFVEVDGFGSYDVDGCGSYDVDGCGSMAGLPSEVLGRIIVSEADVYQAEEKMSFKKKRKFEEAQQ